MDEVVLHASFAAAQPAGAVLGANEVHVWAVPLHGDPERWDVYLSKAERQRLERFHFADHRRRYQIGHGALRVILGGYLQVEPAALDFTQGPRGKPYVVGKPLFFNLSHSGKLAVIGLAATEIGVDVEKVRRLDSLGEIARKHFSPSEFEALSALAGEARELAFYRCWTRKEAYIKAVGEGLTMPLDTFDVSLCEEPRFLDCRDGRGSASEWSLLDVSPGPEFVGAAALRVLNVVCKRFRLESS